MEEAIVLASVLGISCVVFESSDTEGFWLLQCFLLVIVLLFNGFSETALTFFSRLPPESAA